ncbi:MAG: hypothetical protein ACI4JJ_07980 [Huintestinicola sp.]
MDTENTSVFINFTVHPSDSWDTAQTAAAKKYGRIVDIPFPTVDPHADEEQVTETAARYFELISSRSPSAVLCQGEMTLCFAVVQLLKNAGITVLCATSERAAATKKLPDGSTEKISYFKFVGFRRY